MRRPVMVQRRELIGTRQRLGERVKDLEGELAVWKLGHREAVKDREGAERQIRELTVSHLSSRVGLARRRHRPTGARSLASIQSAH